MLPMQKKEGWNITAKWNFFFFLEIRENAWQNKIDTVSWEEIKQMYWLLSFSLWFTGPGSWYLKFSK